MKIGTELKRLRMINSLTQEELASRADLTKGYISQVENETTCPSIATLKDILDVFGVSMQEFFTVPVETEVVFGSKARVRSTADDDPVTVELLVPGAQNRELDPALVTLAGCANGTAGCARGGRVWLSLAWLYRSLP